MIIRKNPPSSEWDTLCERPAIDTTLLTEKVRNIFLAIQNEGDDAMKTYTDRFDTAWKNGMIVQTDAIDTSTLDNAWKNAVQMAIKNVRDFHKTQVIQEQSVLIQPGVNCWRKNIAIQRVGLYVPGGSAPLYSSLYMLAIPAQLAGCPEIIVCTPPNKEGTLDPRIAYVAQELNINEIYLCGGAQAIAGMAIGTNTIPSVQKIFGPGNQWVTEAKKQAQEYGVAIDMPAGPSEVLVIADDQADPAYVAADLLAQAEHGPDSQVVLACISELFAENVNNALKAFIPTLPRQEIIEKALKYARILIFDSLKECVQFSNYYAPEHLIIQTGDSDQIAAQITQAGSVFIGAYTPESAGDYASGTNHTLPTSGWAASSSGVSVDQFVKKITYQKITDLGLQSLGPVVETLAQGESLDAHALAVRVRLQNTTS